MGLATLIRSSKIKVTFVTLAVFVSLYAIITFGTIIEYTTPPAAHECRARSQTSTQPFSVMNSERVNKVRKYCLRNADDVTNAFPDFKRLKDVLVEWTWLASSKHELFYCATPKCGSTTWKSFLLEDLYLTWTVDTHVAAAQVLGVKSLYKDSGDRSLLEFLESYRPSNRLIIVRNPWARLVSAYEDKIIDQKWDIQRLCLAGRDYQKSNNITFETFIDCLLKSDRSVIWNPHIHPLTSLCALCHMDYNLIVRLEEMKEGEPYLLDKLNVTRTVYIPPRKLKHKTYRSMYQNISIESVKQLQEIYQYDIELFGYPKTPFD